MLGLEPEAASILCRSQPEVCSDSTFRPGVKYMILDCGGGTVDIVVHKLIDGDRVEELIRPYGGPWGSTYIDKDFRKLLSKVLDADFKENASEEQWLFSSYEQDSPADAVWIMKQFEDAKLIMNFNVDPVTQAQQTASIRLPTSFTKKYCQDNLSLLIEQAGRRGVFDKLILTPSAEGRILPSPMAVNEDNELTLSFALMQSLFQPYIDLIVKQAEELLRKQETVGVSHIFLVGGFAANGHLHQAVLRAFPRLTVVRPAYPALSVVKGAVRNGFYMGAIKTRISAYTYGMAICGDWVEAKHGRVRNRGQEQANRRGSGD
jgi:hypothetical protein